MNFRIKAMIVESDRMDKYDRIGVSENEGRREALWMNKQALYIRRDRIKHGYISKKAETEAMLLETKL